LINFIKEDVKIIVGPFGYRRPYSDGKRHVG
jgi:hypothetical protein